MRRPLLSGSLHVPKLSLDGAQRFFRMPEPPQNLIALKHSPSADMALQQLCLPIRHRQRISDAMERCIRNLMGIVPTFLVHARVAPWFHAVTILLS
jgi:hypothetical protein